MLEIHVQQFSTSKRVVIKSQEPRGIPSATLKVTPSYFINKYKKKRPKEIPRDADSPTFLLYYWHTSTPKLEILVTILLLGAKLGERAKSMKIKVKQARRKIRVWKKKHHVSGYWTDNVCLAMNQLSQNAVQANKHCIIKNIF